MTLPRRLLLAIATALFGLLLAEVWRPSGTVAYRIELPPDASWITTRDKSQLAGCYRKDFAISHEIKSAWVAIACEGGFELISNGNTLGGFSLWRPTRPFQNGLSEAGQRAYNGDSAMALNFPREYQWTLHANHSLPVWFDLRPSLRGGNNTLALDVEARKPGARVLVFGEITLVDGSVIPLRSDESWLAEPVPKGVTQFEWTRPEVKPRDWHRAEQADAPNLAPLRVIPDGAFREEFASKLFSVPTEDLGKKDLVFQFDCKSGETEAFLRILSNVPYRAWLNGRPIQPNSKAALGLASGDWLVSWEGRRPLAVMPTLLDSEDTVDAWGGERFLDPKHGDPTDNNFQRFRNEMNRTGERPSANRQGELLFDQYGEKEEKGRITDPKGYLEEPIKRLPLALSQERSVEEFSAFGIGRLLKKGSNELRIRLASRGSGNYRKNQAARIAIDGWADDGKWQEFTNASDWLKTDLNATEGSPVVASLQPDLSTAPRLKYLGDSGRPSKRRLVAPALAVLVFFGSLLWKRKKVPSFLFPPLVAATLTAASFYGIKSSFLERSEILFFMRPHWPLVALGCALLAAVITYYISSRKRLPSPPPLSQLVLPALLLLVFFLRIWKVDFQPIDDDEFASIQASVAIAEKGVPEIGEGIWYSRSPLYHYLAGAAAWIFGPHLWALRGLSVLAGVATGWIIWKIAIMIFHSRTLAALALFLYALHPFLIFSSHIARFYQQQQLFLIFGIWTFIRGFVMEDPKGNWRIGSLAAFTAAILSQEISITMGPVIGIVFILFARRTSFASDFRLAIACILAGALIFVDILLFQLKCMTRSVGVSPNVEATISPVFWEPGNFLAMAIGYSRLHLILSTFVLVSLFSALKNRSREALSLHFFTFGGITACNLLITSVSFRYQYTLIALWILLAAHGMHVTAIKLAEKFGEKEERLRLASTFTLLLATATTISWSPWRTPPSYSEKLLGDPISPLRHVAAQKTPGDKVMITEPHPHAAKMEVGKADYDLVVPLLHDFTYRSANGVLRDRNADAEVVNNLAKLQNVFSSGNRVWILLNREKFRSRGKNLRWEYPGAREELFIRKNCQLVYRSHLWHLYLWDPAVGRYHPFRSESNAWVD
ncbi:glycosyltransferase family 39 protein [Roseibacillus persicicus]|uniref:ArnT family glycosyltransferase n=1 Tax=Roseibacillus persicicus TaxID=454148 RepID=UPI00398B6EFB